jgi:thiamine-phosphate pyrophosphorylase
MPKLNGLYAITDTEQIGELYLLDYVKLAIEGGATIIQLRDKKSSRDTLKVLATTLQKICKENDVLFVLNDDIELAIELECDGLHIGKSDYHRFEFIRSAFDGVIGVSCYGDIAVAKEFEQKGADYVAFGSFYHSYTKPKSNIVHIETLKMAKENLDIPICAIGGINIENLETILQYSPDMVSIISDLWLSNDIKQRASIYTKMIKDNQCKN